MATALNRVMVFTDIVDSTRMSEGLGDIRAAAIWSEHDCRARALFAPRGGREIDRTDGFFLLFDDVAAAAAFACDYHGAIAELDVAARVAVHVGPVIVRENTPEDIAHGAKVLEVEGLGKALAARVLSLARGGQTLLTPSAREALADGVPQGAAVRSHGRYRLKGIAEPVEVFELAAAGASFLPPVDADKAYRVVHVGGLWLPVRDVPHNLPAERDAFVGRASELRALADRLDAGARLVTLTGTGGTGKTRLARRYAWTWLGDWPGGVFFCDLSEARTQEAIYYAVGAALSVPLGRGDAGAQLGHAIAGRGRCLVVLDNFEQVVEHVGETAGAWLDRAQEAAFIVTSRERLRIPGEEVFPVDPLSVGADGMELFATRAHAQRPDFAVTDANRADVAEVVRMLDGLPLAIELAAARIPLLSPAQLVARMRDRFAILTGARGVASRRATLRAAIDWSWELLAPWEQDALAQCSVFDGGFTLEAVESVLDLERWPDAPPAMDVVQALCDKNLLRTWIPATSSRYDIDEPLFGMYVTIREYASQKLDAAGESARRIAEVRQGMYFASFGADEEAEALFVHGGVRRRHALALELDNFVGACRRALARGDGRVAASLLRVIVDIIEPTGPYALATELAAHVLAMAHLDDTCRAHALSASAVVHRRAGRAEEALAAGEAALRLHRLNGDRRCEALCLNRLGNVRREQGQLAQARALQQSALTLARDIGYRRVEGCVRAALGIIDAQEGAFSEARVHVEEALAIHREVGDRYNEGIETCQLGNVCCEDGNVEDAVALYRTAAAIGREVGSRRDEATAVANLGEMERHLGRLQTARECQTAALQIARELGDPSLEGNVIGLLANALRADGRAGEAFAYYERAVAIHRELGNRDREGIMLELMGELLGELGRYAEARAAFASGEAILREIGAAPTRAVLLSEWARTESRAGDMSAMRDKLDLAEAVVREAGMAADSDAGRQVAAARAQLLG